MNTQTKRRTVWLFIAACAVVFFFLSSSLVHAQSLGTGMTLSLDPSNPRPYSSVTVSLDAYAFNLTGATVRWYRNGAEISEARNAKSAVVETGAVGTSVTVRADVALSSGETQSTTRTISPADIDLILEANTSVPIFYKGRALGTPGSDIYVLAAPNLPSAYNTDTLTYTWKLDNKVLFGGPARGKKSITLTMPDFTSLLFVSVHDSKGTQLTGKTITLNPTRPELHFYEVNPLRGQSRVAVGDNFTLIEEETSVRAEPYFVNANQNGTIYEWGINGQTVQNTNQDQQLITLRNTGGIGNAQIEFSMVNEQSLMQRVKGLFNIYFEMVSSTFGS